MSVDYQELSGKLIIERHKKDYDLKDIAPTGFSDTRNGMYYANYTGTSRDPKIVYTVSSGYSHEVIVVANVEKIIGLDADDIEKVIDV